MELVVLSLIVVLSFGLLCMVWGGKVGLGLVWKRGGWEGVGLEGMSVGW